MNVSHNVTAQGGGRAPTFSRAFVPFLCQVLGWRHSEIDCARDAVDAHAGDGTWENLVQRTQKVFQQYSRLYLGGADASLDQHLQHMIEEFVPNWSSIRNMQPDPYLSAKIQEELLGIEDRLRSLMQETPSDDSVGHTLQRIAWECGLF